MKSHLALVLIAFLAACQTTPQKPTNAASASSSSSTKESKDAVSFETCNSESFLSLAIARQYLLGGKNRDAVMPYIGLDRFDQDLAAELFRRVDSGEIKHYATFAAEKLYACATREGAHFETPQAKAETCFTKVDIPFFIFLAQQNHLSKGEAIARVERQLKNREMYPSAVIALVADDMYSSPSMDAFRTIQRKVFWNCMYH